MAETVSVRSVEVIESRMLKAQRRYWQSRRRIELLKKQGGHKKELERLRKRTCPNTALEYNILRWVIGYQELRVNYPDDFRLLVYPIPPVSQDFKPKQITIKEAGAGGSEKLSHLDAVPVPDSEVDRLLAGFKVRRLLPFMRGRVLDVGCGAGLISEMLVRFIEFSKVAAAIIFYLPQLMRMLSFDLPLFIWVMSQAFNPPNCSS